MLRFKKILIVLILFALVFGINGCGEKAETKAPDDEPNTIRIVTTTGILGDALKQIGGGLFEVKVLMGPGVDPHLYKASEGDVTRLDRADLIVYNGLHLEGKMADILGKMSRTKLVISAGYLLPEELLLSPPEFMCQHDPHIWFDLEMWAKMVGLLGEKIAGYFPDHRKKLLANSKTYSDQIMALHNSVREKIATIPKQGRVLITAHDAFGYFGRAYNIEVKGLQGISTVSEYGLKDVTDLVDFIVERRIKAVFVESSVPVKSIKAVKTGVLARDHKVIIGGQLYSDALGEKDSPAGNYLGMVSYNVDTIVNALK